MSLVTVAALGCALVLASPPTSDGVESHELQHLISGGLQYNPLGTGHRYDLTRPLDGGFRVGLYSYFQVYSNSVGAQVGYTNRLGWLETHLDVAIEPGFFVRNEDVPAGTVPEQGIILKAPRKFGTRRILRWQTNVNIKLDHIWIYSRTTAMLRSRDFIHFDEFQGIIVQHERWFEEAFALMRRVGGHPPGPAAENGLPSHWLYAEYTIGVLDGYGSRPNKPSIGYIGERWPWPSTTFAFDVYYSFAPEPIDGPGFIFAYFVEF